MVRGDEMEKIVGPREPILCDHLDATSAKLHRCQHLQHFHLSDDDLEAFKALAVSHRHLSQALRKTTLHNDRNRLR